MEHLLVGNRQVGYGISHHLSALWQAVLAVMKWMTGNVPNVK